MNVTMRSRVRERRTHGSVRGLRREPLVYSTDELTAYQKTKYLPPTGGTPKQEI